MTRKLNVQTPGEAPANPEDQADEVQTPGEVLSAGTGPTVEELQARIAELEAEAAKKQAADPEANRKAVEAADAEFETAGRSISRVSREKYLSMRAHEVNPKTLVAAVLTKDGWVAPDQSGQKAKE